MLRPALAYLAVAALASGSALLPTSAHAVDPRVSRACVGDYLSLCSSHDPNGPGVRRCFRANGSNLSSRCVSALVAAGEISKAEVERKTSRR